MDRKVYMKRELLHHLLPLGTVLTLKEGKKKVMIVGRIQEKESGKLYDYAAVLYPEGMIDPKELYLFNTGDIERLYHIGMQDEEEFAFRTYMEEEAEKLGILEE